MIKSRTLLAALAVATVGSTTFAGGAHAAAPAAPASKRAVVALAQQSNALRRAGDWEGLCALGTASSRARLEREAERSCAEIFASEAGKWSASAAPAAIKASTSLRGSGATVRFRFRPASGSRAGCRVDVTVPLQRAGGGWGIDLYGLFPYA